MPHDLPRVTSHNNMNSDNFFCPICGCLHSNRGNAHPFPSQTVLLCHLNSTSHASTHCLVNHSGCAASGIYSCCAPSCPASPQTFFSSLQALNNHYNQAHPPPHPPSPTDVLSPQNTAPPSPLSISTQLLHSFSPPNTTNHWELGLDCINLVYHHKPPDFRTTWHHLVHSRSL
jgi:hypothetical protein